MLTFTLAQPGTSLSLSHISSSEKRECNRCLKAFYYKASYMMASSQSSWLLWWYPRYKTPFPNFTEFSQKKRMQMQNISSLCFMMNLIHLFRRKKSREKTHIQKYPPKVFHWKTTSRLCIWFVTNLLDWVGLSVRNEPNLLLTNDGLQRHAMLLRAFTRNFLIINISPVFK